MEDNNNEVKDITRISAQISKRVNRIFKTGNNKNLRKMTLKNIISKDQFDLITKYKDLGTINEIMNKAHRLGRLALQENYEERLLFKNKNSVEDNQLIDMQINNEDAEINNNIDTENDLIKDDKIAMENSTRSIFVDQSLNKELNIKNNHTNKINNKKIKLNLTEIISSSSNINQSTEKYDNKTQKSSIRKENQLGQLNLKQKDKAPQTEKIPIKKNQINKFNTIIPEQKINISNTIESKYKNMFEDKNKYGVEKLIQETDRLTDSDLKYVSAILDNKSVHPNHIDQTLQMKNQLKRDAKKDLNLFIELKYKF